VTATEPDEAGDPTPPEERLGEPALPGAEPPPTWRLVARAVLVGAVAGLIVGGVFLLGLWLSGSRWNWGALILFDEGWGASVRFDKRDLVTWLIPVGAMGGCVLLALAVQLVRGRWTPGWRAVALVGLLLGEVLVVAVPLTWATALLQTFSPTEAWKTLGEVLGVVADHPDRAAGLALVALLPFWFLGITRAGAVPGGAGRPWPWYGQAFAAALGGFAGWLCLVAWVSGNAYRLDRLLWPMVAASACLAPGLAVGSWLDRTLPQVWQELKAEGPPSGP
jgi:hypothetical protein